MCSIKLENKSCAGSASTAVAAYNQNRNFIGCELSKEYFDKAITRLKEINAIKTTEDDYNGKN